MMVRHELVRGENPEPHIPCTLLGTAGLSMPLALIHVVQWEHHGPGETQPWVPYSSKNNC